MEFLFNPIVIVTVIFLAILIPMLFSLKNVRTHNRLDKAGAITNIVLTFLYVPMSYIGVFSVFFSDGIDHVSQAVEVLIISAIFIGISIPLISIAGILTSFIARKKGLSIFSFCIQFVPLVMFAAMLILIVLTGTFEAV